MKLDNLRFQIDEVDKEIILLLKKRLSLAEKIGNIKKGSNISIKDKQREKEVYENMKSIAESSDLDLHWLKKIFSLILKKSKEKQSEII